MSLCKTKIETLTHCWDPYPGCHHWRIGLCPLGKSCWAKRNAGMGRVPGRIPDKEFLPHLIPENLLDPLKGYDPNKPRRIGVNWKGDLFGGWVNPDERILLEWSEYQDYFTLKENVFMVCKSCPADTFLFLTKNPQNLIMWSPFPDNAYVGASAVDYDMFVNACKNLANVKATVKFISFEPLLNMDWTAPNIQYWLIEAGISWLVIGQQTPVSKKTTPKEIWITEIIEASKKAGIPYFLKNNLKPIMGNDLVQEFPK